MCRKYMDSSLEFIMKRITACNMERKYSIIQKIIPVGNEEIL